MSSLVITRRVCAALCAIGVTGTVSGQATYPRIDVKVIAEVESKVIEDGRDVVKLEAADRVVPGDEVVYTVQIRNAGSTDAVSPVVDRAVPAHMVYVAYSATGPGADVTYSVDGGHTFGPPENLRVPGENRRPRPAVAADYTDIRWRLKSTLKPKSVAYARFRAVVK